MTSTAAARRSLRPLPSAAVAALLLFSSAAAASAGYVVGIDFVSTPVHSPLLTPLGSDPDVYPYQFTDPSTSYAANGALAGYTEGQVEQAIVTAVQDVFRRADIAQPGLMLNVNIISGPVDPAVGTTHLIGRSVPDRPETFGMSYLDGANLRPDRDPEPAYTNQLSVTLADSIATLPTITPGLQFETFDQVINAVAGTTAHEIGHTLGLYKEEPATPVAGVYPIMASGASGLPNEERLRLRRFLNLPNTQPDPPPGGPLVRSSTDVLLANAGLTKVSDFNFSGATDVSDLNIWNKYRFQYGTSIKSGDANGDGNTDIGDLNIWNLNKFTRLDAAPSAAAPRIAYDPATGELSVSTEGCDLFSLIVPGPEALRIDDWQDGQFKYGVVWTQAYFDSKEQWAGTNMKAVKDGSYQIATYAPGLTERDFGQVEYGRLQGEILYTSVAVIPEPATLLMLAGMASAGLWLAWRRRRV